MDNIIEQIFIEAQLSLAKVKYIEKNHDFSAVVYIGQKLQGDYFIYLHLPERFLTHVTNDIQIKLLSLIKNHTKSFEQITDETIDISSSFDKNATLIIFTTHEAPCVRIVVASNF